MSKPRRVKHLAKIDSSQISHSLVASQTESKLSLLSSTTDANDNTYMHAIKNAKRYQYINWIRNLRGNVPNKQIKHGEPPSFYSSISSKSTIRTTCDIDYKGNYLDVTSLAD